MSEKLITQQQLELVVRHKSAIGPAMSPQSLLWRRIRCVGEQKRCIVRELEVPNRKFRQSTF